MPPNTTRTIQRCARLVRIITSRLSTAATAQLVRAEFSKGRRPISVPVGPVVVTIAPSTFRIDYLTLYGALIDRHFDEPSTGCSVLDIGAHKGYFAARCLVDGARSVVSYEPEEQNLAFLQASAIECPNWSIVPAAVATDEGMVELHVSPASWSHSIHVPIGGTVNSTQSVRTLGLSTVLREADPTGKVVVKINVEGAAGEMILSTFPSDWSHVASLWVDIEANDPIDAPRIIGHLESCGLRLTRQDQRRHHFRSTHRPEAVALRVLST